jgi:hypothetical protein
MIATTELPPGPEPGGDMKSRSPDELREIASHGIAGGEMFLAASSEIERRARDADAAIHAREEAAVTQRLRMIWLLAALFVVIDALIIAWLLGFSR